MFEVDIETCPACGGAIRIIALRIRWSSERFSPIWMRKWLSPKPPGGRRAGRRRSGGCSTRRGDNPRMNSFGLWHQRRGNGVARRENRREGEKCVAEAVVGKNSGP